MLPRAKALGNYTTSPTIHPCTGPMPDGYEDYYGFSEFAVELNEMEEDLKDKLPFTDCRFRPDQR